MASALRFCLCGRHPPQSYLDVSRLLNGSIHSQGSRSLHSSCTVRTVRAAILLALDRDQFRRDRWPLHRCLWPTTQAVRCVFHRRLLLCDLNPVENHPNVFRIEATPAQIPSPRDRPWWRWRNHHESCHSAHLENVRVQCAGALLYAPDGLLLCPCNHSPPSDEHSSRRPSGQRLSHRGDHCRKCVCCIPCSPEHRHGQASAGDPSCNRGLRCTGYSSSISTSEGMDPKLVGSISLP